MALVVPEKLGNAGGGKEPQFESSARRKQGHGDWWKRLIAPEAFGHSRRRYMRKPFVGDGMISSESRVRETRTPGSMSGAETWLWWTEAPACRPATTTGRASPRLYVRRGKALCPSCESRPNCRSSRKQSARCGFFTPMKKDRLWAIQRARRPQREVNAEQA